METTFENRIRFIDHAGKQILLLDASNFTNEINLIDFIHYRHNFLMQLNAPKNSLLVVADITNSKQTPKVLEAIKHSNQETSVFYKKVCVVGVSGIKKSLIMLLNKVNSSVPKNTLEEAYEYLVKEN